MKKRQIDKEKSKDLAIIDSELQAMAETGDFDEAMEENFDKLVHDTEPVELTEGEYNRFYRIIKKASTENVIIEARKMTPVKAMPFGRYLQLVRDNGDLSKTEIAKALNKESTDIDRIEKGQTNPLQLLPNDMADIMQLFRISLSELKKKITAFLSLAAAKKGRRVSAMARSSIKSGVKGKEDSLGLDMDAALQAIAQKENRIHKNHIKIDPDYIDAVKQILKERGEQSLLV